MKLPRKPRLLIVDSLARIGGGQRVMLDLLPGLQRVFDVIVCAPGGGPLESEVVENGARFVGMRQFLFSHGRKTQGDSLKFLTSLSQIEVLRKTIAELEVDIILANGGPALLWAYIANMGCVPLIWYNHVRFSDFKTRLLLMILARTRLVRHVAATSQESLEQLVSLERGSVLAAGIDTLAFRPADESTRAALRRQFGIDPSKRVVGCFGDFLPMKRQDMFLEAVRLTGSEENQIVPILVGGFREDAESRMHGEKISTTCVSMGGRVLGWKSTLGELFQLLDILVVASDSFETGPLVLYQALACGVPVVSTRVGRAPRLLSNTSFGILSDGTPSGLQDGIREMFDRLKNPDSIRESARRFAEENLNVETSRAMMTSILLKQIGKVPQ